jgi:hypothetical protein
MVEAATDINLWREWARIEVSGGDGSYKLPPARQEYAGVILSLARQENPDTAAYNIRKFACESKSIIMLDSCYALPIPNGFPRCSKTTPSASQLIFLPSLHNGINRAHNLLLT